MILYRKDDIFMNNIIEDYFSQSSIIEQVNNLDVLEAIRKGRVPFSIKPRYMTEWREEEEVTARMVIKVGSFIKIIMPDVYNDLYEYQKEILNMIYDIPSRQNSKTPFFIKLMEAAEQNKHHEYL
jgi:hypothetical protein